MKTRPEQPADLYYDPYDPVIDKDPYPIWKRMRDEAPLYYNERYNFYALSRFDDVLSALENWRDYSSARGTVLEMMQMDDTPPPGARSNIYGNLGMLIFSDPPEHDIARRLVNQYFSPAGVAAYEARCRTLARQFLDATEGKAEFDLVEEVIRPIPPMMIGHILGVPEEDQARLGRLVDESLTIQPGEAPDRRSERAQAANAQVMEYLGLLIAERTANPRDDLFSILIQSEVELPDGTRRRLATEELLSFFMLLQAAGSETTARALAWAGVLLARHPDQRKKLVDDPGKIRNAVEELVRYEAPSPIQARYVMRDVEWYGVTVPKGSKIALLNGSANRDERQYENPDAFDVERKIRRHLAFGHGTHVCLGAHLARLEMRVVLEELLRRYPEWEVDESRLELVHTSTVRGPKAVPIRVA